MELLIEKLPPFLVYSLVSQGTQVPILKTFMYPYADSIFFTQLMVILENQYSTPEFNAARLSRALCLCSMQAYRRVKLCTGLPPKQCLLYFRLSRAVGLILAGETSMDQIAWRTGFSSHSSFSRAFRRVIGDSPTNFRYHQLKVTTGIVNVIPGLD